MRLGGTCLLPCTEAGEEHDEHPEEEQDHGCEDGPHAGRVIGVRAATVLVDVVLDDLGAKRLVPPCQFRSDVEHTPKSEKSTAMAISVRSQAAPATTAERSEPNTPAPRARRKAMNARPHAIG